MQKWILPMNYPPYSPDLALHDFFLLPVIKNWLKEMHSALLEEVQQYMPHTLKGISEDVFQKYFRMWQKRITLCLVTKQSYFKGYSSN
jgi:hypothetical protein